MTLRAILFDYGNTLVSTRLDWGAVMPANLIGLQAALELHFPQLNYERLSRDFLFMRSVGKQRAQRELIETPGFSRRRRGLIRSFSEFPKRWPSCMKWD
jgi:hypothetical protein